MVVGIDTPAPGNVPDVYDVPLIVSVVVLVGKALMRMPVMVPPDGSVAPNVAAATLTAVDPPGFTGSLLKVKKV